MSFSNFQQNIVHTSSCFFPVMTGNNVEDPPEGDCRGAGSLVALGSVVTEVGAVPSIGTGSRILGNVNFSRYWWEAWFGS